MNNLVPNIESCLRYQSNCVRTFPFAKLFTVAVLVGVVANSKFHLDTLLRVRIRVAGNNVAGAGTACLCPRDATPLIGTGIRCIDQGWIQSTRCGQYVFSIDLRYILEIEAHHLDHCLHFIWSEGGREPLVLAL